MCSTSDVTSRESLLYDLVHNAVFTTTVLVTRLYDQRTIAGWDEHTTTIRVPKKTGFITSDFSFHRLGLVEGGSRGALKIPPDVTRKVQVYDDVELFGKGILWEEDSRNGTLFL